MIVVTFAAILFAAWLLDRAAAVPVLAAIKAYQIALSPLVGGACRFRPTCSAYMYSAVSRYGVVIGCLLGVFRVARCQPLCRGGFDPP
ncbi:MAG: membrane protein insertion efficiency factor YidD [Thermogutta sp.]|nr:membrane protein insertion efficiency factor YidD [Thermogutta sp.]